MSETVPITVSIPVGPNPANKRWLSECVGSVLSQNVKPSEILIIDDGANLEPIEGVRIWKTPWVSGVAHAFNFGVALAENDLVIMLGSDDKLMNDCVSECWKAWENTKDSLGYYAMCIRYDDGREQNVPCNAAMVHKELWRHTGGFPIESSIGACDTMLLSMMMACGSAAGNIRPITNNPIYWYRQHPETDTNERRDVWSPYIASIRNLVTERARLKFLS